MERRVASAMRAEEPHINPGRLIVSGLLAEAKGVSEGARLSLRAFTSAGLSPLAHDLRPLFAQGPGAGKLPASEPGGVLFLHVNAPEAIQALGRLSPDQWLGRYRIGYWAYELPRIPADWVRISSVFHEIWTPSQFVAAALQASGVRSTIRHMPHPVALGDPPEQVTLGTFGFGNSAFTVLALGDLQSSASRKNLAGAIDIFCLAFPSPGEARLIVKIREGDAHPAFLDRARAVANGRADIHIMTGELSPHDVRRLIAGCDVLLSPHRSEGFGLPLAEAFLAGVPALATGWSGNLDFMSGTPELLIDYTLVPVSDPYGVYRAPGQQWAEPDSSDAVTKLRKLANNPGLRRELAEEGRNAVLAFNRHWQRDSLLQHKIGQLTAGAPTAHSG